MKKTEVERRRISNTRRDSNSTLLIDIARREATREDKVKRQ